MDNMTSRTNITKNFFWRFAERCGAQGIAFVVSIVLARLLAPEAYGVIALVTVFTNILNVFVDSGMGNALIQRKNADDTDFSTVFFFNMLLCIVLYAGMFVAAPWIAAFYENPELTAVVRVLSLTLIISGVKNVQQAYVSRTMQFKKFFFSTLGGTIGSAVVGIAMAYAGFGVWALVAQQIFNQTVDTIILWITVKWRPKLKFSFKRLKGLFAYGWKLLASSLLDTVYNNIRQVIIGKVYSSADLAYYNKGKHLPYLVITNVNVAIDSVLFPAISSKQDEIDRVKAMTRRAIKTSSFIIWPIVLGLAACAEPVVRILLTEKWMKCVPFLKIFCFTYGFWPIHTANLNAIKAVGRSDIFLKLEIIKKTIGIISILISMPFGVLAMAMAYLITSPLSAIVNATPNRKLLGYKYREQLADMLPSMLLGAFMAMVVYAIGKINLNDFALLPIQVIVGAVIYIAGAKLLKFESLNYILSIVKKKR
ncbi:lipopolysaccharide biosynthesis protein [Eubacterium sp. AF15-50]|uniref:Lipopolysaccharide biosynthesis protein n=1 Tax=Eubacterium segne TaxID=2763045 RepID=A0ABR7F5G3_9FIRM|nr:MULTISPECIES: lipopolysaccharide biosynthesis protein [Eubacterium]MBC5668849.1 lipopolysaccharide biosynthesis protein [Eubacterium segne]RHR70324.1 lipopolysaccharide biosynthesis protein [Eubacterium sp. AF16-48]RHR78807.1 lipopolysaccharide biosynthesis protein [Eubacterium sp. AF15-50]